MKAQTIERDHRSLAASVREGLNNGGSLEPLEGTPGDSKVAELYIFLPTAFLPFPIPSIHFFPPWRHACLIPDPFITRRKRPPTEVSSHRWPRTWGCPPLFFPFFLSLFCFPSETSLKISALLQSFPRRGQSRFRRVNRVYSPFSKRNPSFVNGTAIGIDSCHAPGSRDKKTPRRGHLQRLLLLLMGKGNRRLDILPRKNLLRIEFSRMEEK